MLSFKCTLTLLESSEKFAPSIFISVTMSMFFDRTAKNRSGRPSYRKMNRETFKNLREILCKDIFCTNLMLIASFLCPADSASIAKQKHPVVLVNTDMITSLKLLSNPNWDNSIVGTSTCKSRLHKRITSWSGGNVLKCTHLPANSSLCSCFPISNLQRPHFPCGYIGAYGSLESENK